jgi:hypothetical protein
MRAPKISWLPTLDLAAKSDRPELGLWCYSSLQLLRFCGINPQFKDSYGFMQVSSPQTAISPIDSPANLQGGHTRGLASTNRSDGWWIEPMVTGLGFLAFVVYANWAAFQGAHYFTGNYLSPFYSPLLYVDPTAQGAAPISHAWFGAWPQWWPAFIPASPALLILAGPLGFRMTCYYYRKFYYRAYFATPPACAVGPYPQSKYRGESGLLILQNIHRYMFYPAVIFIVVLFYDAFCAFFKDGEFGIGVGTIILTINPILLSGYTFGCHAFRHLIGGRLDCFSCPMGEEHMGHKVWSKVSLLNGKHMLFAWASLIWVGLADAYVRLVSMGIITDINSWD